MVKRWMPLTAAFLFALFVRRCLSIAPIEAVGSKLYDSETGNQFYIRGVSYRIFDDLDPLSVPEQCELDASLMKTLGVNTIRVYEVDSTRSHDECMSSFADAGIYVIIGLSGSDAIISGYQPEWTLEMYMYFTKSLDAFAKYDNLLAVTVGNEVVDETSTSGAAPYIKAAIRDLKAYRDGQRYRKILVGYASADYDETRLDIQNYLVCGDTIADNTDFFGLNRFSWCGNSTFEDSGYSYLYGEAGDYPVPIFFSETGCGRANNRDFDDQQAILGFLMNDKWSGAIIYEWREEINSYGIASYPFQAVTWTASGTPPGLTPTPLSPDFYNLQSQWNTLTPTGTPSTLYTPVYTSVACPSSTVSSWSVAPTALLPTIANLVITTKPAATLSGVQASSGQPLPTLFTSSSGNSRGSALSTGARVAIGVVVPVVALASAIIFFLLWRRRRKTKTKSAPDEKGPQYSEVTQSQNSPMQGVGEFYKPPESEVDGNPVSQLHGDGVTPELGSQMVHHIGDPERELAELDAYSPPLELGLRPSVRRASRESGTPSGGRV
ncbi:MAG: hypothetical protein Q9219_000595 [cf. Caloplaca sp. 3 TL-2023]